MYTLNPYAMRLRLSSPVRTVSSSRVKKHFFDIVHQPWLVRTTSENLRLEPQSKGHENPPHIEIARPSLERYAEI